MTRNTLRNIGDSAKGQDKSYLLGLTAQQLRSPLTALQLQLQLLARSAKRAPTVASPQLLQKLDLLTHQAWRLSEIVEFTDDLAKVLQGELKAALRTAPAELGQLGRDLVMRLHDQAREQSCQLTCQNNEPVWGEWDAARLRRLLLAVLHNALVYAPHGEVTLSIHGDQQNASVEIRDYGPGISDLDLTRLEPKLRVPPRTQSGAGVGLWMAAHLAHAMDGQLTAERAADGGTRITLTLPRKPSPAPDAP